MGEYRGTLSLECILGGGGRGTGGPVVSMRGGWY